MKNFLRRIFPNDPDDSRKWHQKKRYRFLMAFVALSLISGLFADDTAVDPSRAEYEESYGVFTPKSFSGTGPGVFEIDAEYGVLRISHQGEGNFELIGGSSLGLSKLELSGSGVFQTELDLGFTNSDVEELEVTTDSEWSIELLPISQANALVESSAGNGVFVYDGPAVDWELSNQAGAIEIWQADLDEEVNKLLEADGELTVTVSAMSGPSVVIIKANDSWQLSPQQ